jgi:GT2 family glycosyltransferase
MDQQAPAGWEFFDSADFPAATPDDPLERAPLRHVVTAVVVAHNGAEWLPRLTEALWALERRPDRLIAIDTGSTDNTAALLNDLPGVEPVVSASARTGYGTAVARGLETVGFAPAHSPWRTDDDRAGVVEWLWLLHDDCAPAPKALEQLLLQATISPEIAVWGPKLRTWPRERALLEVGVTTSLGGRRDTGIEPGEFDQGQHDKVRDVLAVSSAGMLVRRDVWRALKGFDPRLPIFRDDIDFGWRARRAGYRVAVAPDSVVYHAQAAAGGEREMAGTRRHAYQVDRAHAYYTVLANVPGKLIPLLMLRMLLGTVLRSLWFVLGKTPSGAIDEWTAFLGTLLAGGWMQARRDRRRLRTVEHEEYKNLFSKSVHAIRHNLEETGNAVTERLREAWSDEEEDQPQVTTARRARTTIAVAEDQPRWRKQLIRRPFLVAWVVLLAGSLVAMRGVVGSGVLRSTMLLPPHDNLGDLWHAAATAPPGVTPPAWLGQLSVFSALTFGSPSVAVDLLLLGVVPLAAWSAWNFLRRIVLNRAARAWGAAAYGLAVVAGGAVTQGRIGTCVAALVLPLLAIAMHTVLRRRRAVLQGSWRAAWFAGAVLAVLVAFTPALGVLLVLGIAGVATLVVRRNHRQASQLFWAAALGPLLVLPWTMELVRHPWRLGQEAGGPPTTAAGPGSGVVHLLTAVPDAPGVVWWFAVPLVLVALLSLFRDTRHRYELVGWAVAITGLVATLLSSRLGGGSAPLMFLTTIAWIGVVTVAWGSVRRDSGPVVRAAIGAVLVATVATAGWWIVRSDDDPLHREASQDLPAYLVAAEQPPEDATIVVVRQDPSGGSRYAVVRAGGPRMGALEAEAPAESNRPLTDVLSALGGGGAGDEALRLDRLGVDYVYLAPPIDPTLVATLDTVAGLTRSSAEEGGAAWVVDLPQRSPVPSGEVTHTGWRVAGILAWLITLVFCLPTARRSVVGSHARRAAS